MARLLKTDPVHKVIIIPRGRALGVTMQLPETDRYSQDRDRLMNMIAVLFGGRIAEELFMNQMTTGASNDFERATEIACCMVTQWGMSTSSGLMVYGENDSEVFLGRRITTHKNVSEATMQKVDAEIRRIIDQQYHRAAPAGEPRQGRGDDQGAARVRDDRCRPDRRHHVGQAAAPAEGAGAQARPPPASDAGAEGATALAAGARRTLYRRRFEPALEQPPMGVVNITPDLFRRSGRFFGVDDALTQVALADEGADIIDIGGESTRPGAELVSEDEELRARHARAREARRPLRLGGQADGRKS